MKNHILINGIDHKLCNRCEQNFHATEEYFYPNKSNKTDGLYPYCILCAINKAKGWQSDNIEAKRASNRKYMASPKAKQDTRDRLKEWRKQGGYRNYYKNNKGKFEVYNKNHIVHEHDITDEEWFSCLDFFNWSCAYCEFPWEEHLLNERQQLHKDHVDPRGSIYIENCVPSCRYCNSEKHDSDIIEWYNETNPKYTVERFDKIVKWVIEDSIKLA